MEIIVAMGLKGGVTKLLALRVAMGVRYGVMGKEEEV